MARVRLRFLIAAVHFALLMAVLARVRRRAADRRARLSGQGQAWHADPLPYDRAGGLRRRGGRRMPRHCALPRAPGADRDATPSTRRRRCACSRMPARTAGPTRARRSICIPCRREAGAANGPGKAVHVLCGAAQGLLHRRGGRGARAQRGAAGARLARRRQPRSAASAQARSRAAARPPLGPVDHRHAREHRGADARRRRGLPSRLVCDQQRVLRGPGRHRAERTSRRSPTARSRGWRASACRPRGGAAPPEVPSERSDLRDTDAQVQSAATSTRSWCASRRATPPPAAPRARCS